MKKHTKNMEKNKIEEKILYTKKDGRSIIILEGLGECSNCDSPLYIVRFYFFESIYRPFLVIKCKECGWRYKIEDDDDIRNDVEGYTEDIHSPLWLDQWENIFR